MTIVLVLEPTSIRHGERGVNEEGLRIFEEQTLTVMENFSSFYDEQVTLDHAESSSQCWPGVKARPSTEPGRSDPDDGGDAVPGSGRHRVPAVTHRTGDGG